MTTIRYEKIKNFNDLYDIGVMIKKGILKMPNITKMAKHLGCSRDKARNVLNGVTPKKTRNRKKYLDNYKSILFELLNDQHSEFDYIQHLYNYMVREYQITCSYSTFRLYIKSDEELNSCYKKSSYSNKFIERFETLPGEQAQFDLKEDIPITFKDGRKTKIHIATLTMGYSRFNIRLVILDKSYNTIENFLAMSFEMLGGVPKELVIDNIKCLVDKPRTSNTPALINSKFIEFSKDYNFNVKPCMLYRPQTKVKTETQNKVPSQIKNYNGTYIDLHEVVKITKIINDEDNASISQATGLPAEFLLKKEKAVLNKLPCQEVRQNHFFKMNEVAVTNDCLFSYKGNKYSVPKAYQGKKIGIVIFNNRLHIYFNKSLITCHEISKKKINILESHDLSYITKHTTCNENKTNMIDSSTTMSVYGGILYDNI